ncbi:hypothetical protein FH972_024400 [Carpinus fangiana]|uniref:Uncharacterized protein n=1 Tax=Carpinus fangiana TaxID=176857 RepID=A0A5N6KYF1_9ROSI|nr:hypothetical protein FH972_024400 [Carpinus fangiana]
MSFITLKVSLIAALLATMDGSKSYQFNQIFQNVTSIASCTKVLAENRLAEIRLADKRLADNRPANNNDIGCTYFSYGEEVDGATFQHDTDAEDHKLNAKMEEYAKLKISKKSDISSKKDVVILLKAFSTRRCDGRLLDSMTGDRVCYPTPGASSVKVFKLPHTCHIYAFLDASCGQGRRLVAFDDYDEGDTGMCMHTDPFESLAVVCRTAL